MTAAWRFDHPDAPRATGLGLATTPAGRVALVSGDEAVRQSLVLLLSTVPGERVMRPAYGCPLHRLVFEPLDETTAGLAIHYVEQSVRRWEPRAQVVAVDAYPSHEVAGALTVVLDYRVRASSREDRLVFDLPLTGEDGA